MIESSKRNFSLITSLGLGCLTIESLCLSYVVLFCAGDGSQRLYMLSMHSTTELHPSSSLFWFLKPQTRIYKGTLKKVEHQLLLVAI